MVSRSGDQLVPTAQLLLAHLADAERGEPEDRFRLLDDNASSLEAFPRGGPPG